MNRKGETLIQSQSDDLTIHVKEVARPEETQTKAGSIGERVMNRLMTSEAWMSRSDLNSDPLVGGSVSAVKKTLQRLEARGVVEVKEEKSTQGLPVKLYRVLLAQGESGQVSHVPQTSSKNKGSERGHKVEKLEESEQCPLSDSSAEEPSEGIGGASPYSRARTDEEINQAIDQSVWD
jgi:hypothetical protein